MATPMRSPFNIIQKLLCCIPSLLAKLLAIKFKCELGEWKRVPRTLMLLKILTHKTLLHTLHNEQPPFLLLCQAILTCFKHPSLKDLPPSICALLHEFQDIFPKDGPHGLPPFRGIEHQIDFVPRASLPNRLTYRTNLIETKEIETQVNELLDKGWVQNV